MIFLNNCKAGRSEHRRCSTSSQTRNREHVPSLVSPRNPVALLMHFYFFLLFSLKLNNNYQSAMQYVDLRRLLSFYKLYIKMKNKILTLRQLYGYLINFTPTLRQKKNKF